MKPGAGKGKGGSFERTIGADLSLWLSHGERRDLICRTVGSGAQFTVSNSKCGNPGDLMAQDPLAFEFFKKTVIECKHWKSLNLIQFLSKEGDLWKALKKVEKEAGISKKYWLVAKQNHIPTFLFTNNLNLVEMEKLEYHILFSETVIMYKLNSFLELVNPEVYLLGESFGGTKG